MSPASASSASASSALREIPISSVRLDPSGLLGRAQRARLDYLRTLDVDRLLVMFRRSAGLPDRGAEPMTGWDSPDCLLRGHTTGHALSALALCHAATGDDAVLGTLDALIDGLVEVRDAFAKRPGIHPGFLSAYDESQFDDLERFVPYPTIWAPYYTLHKLIAGLLDAYDLTGSEPALDLARGLGLWTARRLGRLPASQLQRMWGMYIAGEFGGLNESLALLADRLKSRRDDTDDDTDDDADEKAAAGMDATDETDATDANRLTDAARLFDNDRLMAPLLHGVDALDGMHANQHIPQVIGWVRLYERTGENRYLTAAKRFWREMTADHMYAFGGFGRGEMLHAPGVIAGELGEETAESCATYNMVKLAHRLRLHEGARDDARDDARGRVGMGLADYVELATRNHLLASVSPRPDGGSTYFLPTTPGGVKSFDLDGNTCCHGTGMETPFRFAEGMALVDMNRSALHLTQYLPGSIADPSTGIRLRIKVRDDNPGHVAIDLDRMPYDVLCLRVPWWATGRAADRPIVMMNDVTLRVGYGEAGSDGAGYDNADHGGVDQNGADYDGVDRELILDHHALAQAGLTSWAGAHIDLMFRPRLAVTATPDDPSVVSVSWGPYVLAALHGPGPYGGDRDGSSGRNDADQDNTDQDGIAQGGDSQGGDGQEADAEPASTNTNAHMRVPPVDVADLMPIDIDPDDPAASLSRLGHDLEWVHRPSGIRFRPIGLIDVGQPYHLYLRLG
ncbi:beta-L-arabinofuranosidase domain-containing protein [Bifidobacterium simiarum]|uniref:Non-reducing end beta-L-arabinofuranosidase-like GH127 catalytic domain-containing protein n=1 Tax=Bifidobacterium simiarum TaxID=2045441 RepID=A0A2M9HCW7_9BIFI|nr:beta-L-arabinofuranosidase domain-containing protein [Bifidobacterium simiarum]PJM74654.1 hypothetical protein CSQ87_08930 [Bifidobacterium simiarum]